MPEDSTTVFVPSLGRDVMVRRLNRRALKRIKARVGSQNKAAGDLIIQRSAGLTVDELRVVDAAHDKTIDHAYLRLCGEEVTHAGR